jgi:peroxiredoxin
LPLRLPARVLQKEVVMSLRSIARIVPLVLAPAAPLAQHPEVGAPAPAITADAWLNWEGDPPTLESLAGRVVMLEFWGTWCGPCVRAMPGIQKLHDRYRERGLTVLAISYEPAAKMQPFLTENAYTMPVGSDPEKKTIAAYGIRGWPTTIVIDKVGKVAHVGSPYDAESAVEKALGIEAGPAALLDLWLDSQGGKDKAAEREALERLVEKAPPTFDLQSWAKAHCPPETVAEGGEAPTPSRSVARTVDGTSVLRRCVKAWGKEPQRAPLVQQLADAGSTEFDLKGFAQECFAEAFPLDTGELKSLLHDKKYAGVVEAIAQRAPSTKVLATAARDKDLASYCKSKVGEARTMAKKGLMAQLWVFPGALPKDEAVNLKFFGELSVSGIATSNDKKSITGIMLGGEMLMREQVLSFVASQLTQALVMESLADGKAPKLASLTKECDKERDAIVKDLEGRYGKPEPRTDK